MKHLGSVTDIHGAEIKPVDIITFGSPCQDLSVAGKRAGLKHEANGDEETTRSGLFMEAVRIIKEMRRATNGLYPSFAVWENVPGAFSSNRGEDFRIVLEELIKIVEPRAVMPAVPQKGWAYADSYSGDGWSLAYRTFDAQYWGVPQRRRRIYLVLDLRGERAHKVLFERDGLRGYFEEGRSPWQATAGNAENCTATADSAGDGVAYGWPLGFRPENVRVYEETATTICNGTRPGFTTGVIQPICMATQQGGAEIRTDDKAPTITAAAGMSGNNQPVVCYEAAGFKAGNGAKANGIGWQEEVAPTLSAAPSGTNQTPTVCIKTWDARGNGDGETVNTLTGDHENRVTDYTSVVVYESHPMDSRIKELDGVAPTVSRKWHKGAADTPLVCEATIPIHDQATRFSGKRGDKSDGKGNGLGVGAPGDPMNTLTSGDRHAVCYAVDPRYVDTTHADDVVRMDDKCAPLQARDFKGGKLVCYAVGNGQLNQISMAEQANTLDCMHDQQAVVVFDKEVYNSGESSTGGHYIAEGGPAPTLRGTGHPPGVSIRYIVRRLTPTECARLQGFPDTWGHVTPKEDFTDEEYRFWLDVRNTHAAINGKTTKEYTKQQMLTWYNKLHTDSAEYKMWGNGIALPTALYVMQGIAEALERQR